MTSSLTSLVPQNKSLRRQIVASAFGFLTGMSIFLTYDIYTYTSRYQVRPIADIDSTPGPQMAAFRQPPNGDVIPGIMRTTVAGDSPPMVELEARKLEDPVGALNGDIPTILHQTWESSEIPLPFVPWMKTWTITHEEWHYLFWTPEGAMNMINKKFPAEFLFYRNYPMRLQKAEARRYFVMYAYGGVFADLDMESIFGLSYHLDKYSCALAQMPPSNRSLTNFKFKHGYFLSSSFMACRPNHPFFKFLISRLPHHQVHQQFDLLNTTGSFFLSSVLDEYLDIYNSSEEDYVHVLPPEWFSTSYADIADVGVEDICAHKSAWYDAEALCKYIAKYKETLGEGDEFIFQHWKRIVRAHFNTKSSISIYDVVGQAYVI